MLCAAVLQDRVYVPQHKEPAVYDLGLVLFRDEVRETTSSCGVALEEHSMSDVWG